MDNSHSSGLIKVRPKKEGRSIKLEHVKPARIKVPDPSYSKLVVPVSMRSIYWQYFGFPADVQGDIINKSRIVCILCKGYIAYNRNTSNLRMHLQNKHNAELLEIEANAPIKTPKKIRQSVSHMYQDGDGDGDNDSQLDGYYEADTDQNESSAVIDLSDPDAAQSFFFPGVQDKKRGRRGRRSSNEGGSNLVNAITTYIMLDLEPPDVVNGRGFQRLLVNIENPCSVPSKPMLISDIIPKRYKAAKERLQDELAQLTNFMGITMEEWQNADGQNYVSICTNFLSAEHVLQCRMLSTFCFVPEMTSAQWESMLATTFMEWNIVNDRVAAVVCSMERDAMVDALSNLGFNPVPCMDHTIKETVKQCFSNDIIKEIIDKIRKQIALIKNNPQSAKYVQYYQEELQLESNLVLDVEAVWLSTVEMLEIALQWKEGMYKILSAAFGSTFATSLEVHDDEWDIISDLVNCLEPLKITLMSISEEKVPFMSLVRPMLHQVVENKLKVQPSDSETALNLKKAIVDLLNYRYTDERVSAWLDMATVLDPRFRILPHITDAYKEKISENIHNAIKDIIIENNGDLEEPPEKKRLSHMKMLLGEIKPSPVKKDSEGSARLEFQNYVNQSTASLDLDPVQWWHRNQNKFPRLHDLVDKYMCVPIVSTLPGKRTLDTVLPFHAKRSSLSADIVDKLLFLHVNCSNAPIRD